MKDDQRKGEGLRSIASVVGKVIERKNGKLVVNNGDSALAVGIIFVAVGDGMTFVFSRRVSKKTDADKNSSSGVTLCSLEFPRAINADAIKSAVFCTSTINLRDFESSFGDPFGGPR